MTYRNQLTVSFGWSVGWFGFNGLLRHYFSLYRAVSQREGERGEKGQMRVKMYKQPPPAPTASAVGPCPTVIQNSRTPQLYLMLTYISWFTAIRKRRFNYCAMVSYSVTKRDGGFILGIPLHLGKPTETSEPYLMLTFITWFTALRINIQFLH